MFAYVSVCTCVKLITGLARKLEKNWGKWYGYIKKTFIGTMDFITI